MNAPNKYDPPSNTPLLEELPPPCCPHCSKALPSVNCYQWVIELQAGMALVLSIYCPNFECRKLLHTQVMIAPKGEEPGRIARPS